MNILDEGVREALAIEIDTGLPAPRVVRVLDSWNGGAVCGKRFGSINGPEPRQRVSPNGAREKASRAYIQPGKTNQNAYIERYNRSYRTEVLNAWLFESLNEVREVTSEWIRAYNEERPHDALGNLLPIVFRERHSAP